MFPFEMKDFFKNNKNRMIFFKTAVAGFLFFLSFGFQSVFLKNPGYMKQMFKKSSKTIKEISVQLLTNDMKIRAITRREDGFLKLKISKIQDDGEGKEINNLIIGRYEAFFEYGEETISLGTLDYDGNGSLEIIAAGFDEFFRPSIYIMEYNKRSGKFEKRNFTSHDLRFANN